MCVLQTRTHKRIPSSRTLTKQILTRLPNFLLFYVGFSIPKTNKRIANTFSINFYTNNMTKETWRKKLTRNEAVIYF